MKCLKLICLVCFLNSQALFAAESDDLVEGFQSPPRQAKPSAYWLWLNGYANRSYFDQELRAFADKGIGGLCIFDMGARGDLRFAPPAGPPFMGDESLQTIAEAIEKARRYGLDAQLAACSSWDLGGSWVQPEEASMALYRSELTIAGPLAFDDLLPNPRLPSQVPKNGAGQPAFLKEVAVLAVPLGRRQPAHEFIYRLPRGDVHQVGRVRLSNAQTEPGANGADRPLFAKKFSIAVSTAGKSQQEFREILADQLQPQAAVQTFEFPPTDARYVRLRVFDGYNAASDQVELAEFEVYSTDDLNVAASFQITRTRDTAELVWCNSEADGSGRWAAENLNDGSTSGASGGWRSAGLPPPLIEDLSEIVDLSQHVSSSGRLTWQVPPGNWKVMRFVCGNTGERLKVPSPNSDGLATDHFSAAATRGFIDTLTARLQSRLGDLPAAGLKQIYLPSYEVRGAKWTPDLLEQFRKYRGYDMTRYLPVLAGCQAESDERTFRFLYDFQKTLGELLVDAYYRTASAAAHDAGLGIEAEAGGPGPPVHQVPVDALQALGAVDEMRGEFWPWREERDQLWVVKETACAAHVYGRRRVHMEAFTGFRHWEDGPMELKPSADRAFCEGMNHVVWHTASHQPPESGKPGWVYGAGTHLTPNLAWWPLAKPFIDYLSRCSFLLQQGHFVGDVCYYYGDQGANFVPPKRIDPSLGFGYDYDVANPEVIVQRMSVENGRIVLPDGMSYQLLVLPDREDCDLEVLQKIEQLVKAGATVVGRKPTRGNGLTDYPRRDSEVRRLADRVWGDCDGSSVLSHRYGEGQVIWGQTLRGVLGDRGLGPDFHYDRDGGEEIDYIHRRTEDADIYFVRNKAARQASFTATFRVFDRRPELWEADTGSIREQAAFQVTAAGIRVPLKLERFGSTFVVFRKQLPDIHLVAAPQGARIEQDESPAVRVQVSANGNYEIQTSDGAHLSLSVDDMPAAMAVEGDWDVEFPEGWGAPSTATFRQLTAWTEHPHDGIRHFSGLARYRQTATVPARWLASADRVELDLGNLWAVGRVRVNGQVAGIVWKPPYRVDITSAIRPGQNQIEVEIANSWSNRLVGDSGLAEEQRFCRTNITVSGIPGRPWKDVPLRPSGLFGPVQLVPTVERLIALEPR